MKSIIIALLLLLSNICFAQQKQILEIDQASIVIDSVQLLDSIQIGNRTIRYKETILIFPNLPEATQNYMNQFTFYGKFGNDYACDGMLRDMNVLKEMFYESNSRNPEMEPETRWRDVNMRAFSTISDYTMIFQSAEEYNGGAPSYNLFYRVLDQLTKKGVNLEDILIVKNNSYELEQIIAKYWVGYSNKNKTERVPLPQTFYFDEENLICAYGVYEIASYDEGPINISVPLSALKKYLKPSFKQRMNLE